MNIEQKISTEYTTSTNYEKRLWVEASPHFLSLYLHTAGRYIHLQERTLTFDISITTALEVSVEQEVLIRTQLPLTRGSLAKAQELLNLCFSTVHQFSGGLVLLNICNTANRGTKMNYCDVCLASILNQLVMKSDKPAIPGQRLFRAS